jgi:hypothetical protein
MNIREIARHANVSTATVSGTINRHPSVQPRLGRLAFQALRSDVRRESPNPKGAEYVLKTSFVPRDSTAMNSQKRLS